MPSIYEQFQQGFKTGQERKFNSLASLYLSGQQDPQTLAQAAQINPQGAMQLQGYQQKQQQDQRAEVGKIAGYLASIPDANARNAAYNQVKPKLAQFAQDYGLPLPDSLDDSHLPEIQAIAQQWGGMQQPQQLAPRVIGNALVDPNGKVLYQGPQAAPAPRLVQNDNGEYVWVQPPPMPGAPQMGQPPDGQGQGDPQGADNPVMQQADQMARQLSAQGKTDAEIAPIVNDFIAKNYTPSGGIEMAPQPQAASGMMGSGVPTGVRGRAPAQSDIERRIALARNMGANDAEIKAMVLGRSGDQAPAEIPGDATITGPQYLVSLPKRQADQVRALADGRMAFPSGTALKDPYWKGMLAAVAQYDPNFDAVNYNARAKTRSAFTSGPESRQVNALNTVAEHLGTFSDNIAALNNSQYPALNSIRNEYLYQTGDPRIARFNTTKKAVADEVAKVWRQSGGSEADIQENLKNLSGAQSPEQLNAAVATLTQLINGKVMALNDQYTSGMGTTQSVRPLISKEAQAAYDRVLKRAGITAAPESASPQAASHSAPAAPAGWSIQVVQ